MGTTDYYTMIYTHKVWKTKAIFNETYSTRVQLETTYNYNVICNFKVRKMEAIFFIKHMLLKCTYKQLVSTHNIHIYKVWGLVTTQKI